MRNQLRESARALFFGLALFAACKAGNVRSLPPSATIVVTVEPAAATVVTGGSLQLTANVTGINDTSVSWSVVGAGSINATGIYSAPDTPGTYQVMAVSVASPLHSGIATITVVAPTPVVTVSPQSPSLPTGGVVTFSATVEDAVVTDVSWSVTGGDVNGTITADGIYTAPATAGTYEVVATSVADAAATGSATATVFPAPPPTSSVSVLVSPATASVTTGSSIKLTATVTGSANTAVTWAVTGGSASGAVTSTGRYTAPTTPGSYTVVATSVADTTASGSATIEVKAPAPVVAVSLSPTSAAVNTGGTVTFTATVTGTGNTAVTWSVTGGDANGTVSDGVYAAPATAGTYQVVATSVADPTKKATASVTVTAVTISISPTSFSMATGATTRFTASVRGTSNTAVTWSVLGGDANGTINNGVYTAPGTPGVYTVVVTSVADPARKATATVTVTAPVVAVSLNPTSASVATGGQVTFTAVVTGTSNTAVTWTVTGGDTNGTVTSGVYTAPGTTGTFQVVATSVADTSKKATASVTVTAAGTVGITVQPIAYTMKASDTAAFTAVLSGTGDATVTWTVDGGSVTAGGVFTAPAAAGTYKVTATSAADPAATAFATVTVGSVPTGTDVPAGAITTRTWTAAGSPYRLRGDVYIPSGNRLTIQPGVEVRAMGHYRLEGPGIIDARGTSPTQRDIIFTADNKTRGWYGIMIWNGNGAFGVPPDIGDYHLENCIVEYVDKDESNPRSWGSAVYSDEYGAVYVYGANWPDPGVKLDNLHFNGLLLRHNRALYMTSPQGMAGGLYLNGVNGNDPVWTDMVFDDNQAVDYGGAVAAHHCSGITFKNGMMTNNVAVQPDTPGEGGALGYFDAAGPMILDHVIYQGNDPPGFADTGEQYQVIVKNAP